MTSVRPVAIRTDQSNAFAHNTMAVRVPAIIREVQALNPDYSAPIQQALDRLREDITGDKPMHMIDLPAPDYDEWSAAYAAHQGETWQHTEWFFAEHFFYRHLIQAVRWWETRRDPFAPKKAIELASDALWRALDLALSIQGDPAQSLETRLSAAIHNTLWGNRIDLSYALAASYGHAGDAEDLLIDDTGQAVECLLRARGTVHILTDNAGTELAMDLALADVLLGGISDRVIFHLKMHPTFVSDATVPDVLTFFDSLETAGLPAARDLAGRVRAEFTAGRLSLAPDLYWNSSRFLWDMPPRLAHLFQNAELVIVKGDANYRRLIADAVWPYETPLVVAAHHFLAPLLILRTLKSDPIVGLPNDLARRLDGIDRDWRVNGRRGIIQFAAKA